MKNNKKLLLIMKKTITSLTLTTILIAGVIISIPQSTSAYEPDYSVNFDSLSIAIGVNYSGSTKPLDFSDVDHDTREKIANSAHELLIKSEHDIGHSIGAMFYVAPILAADHYEQQGAEINYQKMQDSFGQYFLLDSIPIEQINSFNNFIINAEKKLKKSEAINNDSLSICIGAYMGHEAAKWLPEIIKNRFPKLTCTKEAIISGTKYYANFDHSEYKHATSILQFFYKEILPNLNLFKELDAEININLVAEALKRTTLGDNQYTSNQYPHKLLSTAKRKLKCAKLEKTPEAIANKKAGQTFLSNLKANDKKLKRTEDGILYKVTTPGSGNKLNPKKNIMTLCRIAHFNGSEITTTYVYFDRNGPKKAQSIYKVLYNLKKGAKTTFYIPEHLAFGVEGYKSIGIGPNETLIVDVEIIDIDVEKEPEFIPEPKPEPKGF